jgi:hypothetical protein
VGNGFIKSYFGRTHNVDFWPHMRYNIYVIENKPHFCGAGGALDMPKIIIKMNGKTTEVKVPDKQHLDAQITYPHKVQKSKKTYTRKQKHKGIGKVD